MSSSSPARQRSADACAALHDLAHATRRIDDPRDIYPILGSITDGLAALAQSLHQLGAFHDHPPDLPVEPDLRLRGERAVAYQVAWELHRAAEMLIQVAAGLDRAHEAEASISYDGHHPVVGGVRRHLQAPQVWQRPGLSR